MAHGQRSAWLEKYMHRQYEYWSRRPYFGEGKAGKKLTHRAERRQARVTLEEEQR